ncbi:MAG: hypothetical protein HYY25_01535 [Candidatus Wallbacteria bacterium]|nr:hypothetical protein [Candidatus Wallbacteria bacterium]
MIGRGCAFAGILFVAGLAAGCGGDDDPVGALPNLAADGSSTLTPAAQGLELVTGGSASAAGTTTDARLAELVATAVLASLESGNAGMVVALSDLAEPAASPASAKAARGRRVPHVPRGFWRARAARKTAARSASQVDGSLPAPDLAATGVSRGAPGQTMPGPKPIPMPFPEPPDRPVPLPVDPSTGAGSDPVTGGPVLPGDSTVGSDGPHGSSGISGGGEPSDPGSIPARRPPEPTPMPNADGTVDPTTGAPPERPLPPEGPGDVVGTMTREPSHATFTPTADGFRFQDGPSELVVHGAVLSTGVSGEVLRIDIQSPVRAEGTVTDEGGLMRIDLTLTGVTGVMQPPADGQPDDGPRFQLTTADSVSLKGRIDRMELELTLSGVASQFTGITELDQQLRGRTLGLTLLARNVADELESVSLRLRARDVALKGDAEGSPTAAALWGRAELAFTSTSEPYARDNVRAAVFDVDESHALSLGAGSRPRSGVVAAAITHRDGRKSQLRATLGEGEVRIEGTLAGAAGGTDRVEPLGPGRARVTGETRLAGGARERHEVEIQPAADTGRRQARVRSRISDGQGREMVEVDLIVAEDRSGGGSWTDHRLVPARSGRFEVDSAGSVLLRDASGSELARANVPRRR